MINSSSQTKFDVAIIGAGPAGAMAALALSQANIKTAIFEKYKLPRYKTCGGGLTYRAIKLINFDISSIVEKSCYQAQLNLIHNRLQFTTKREQPIVTMTMRDQLDLLLINRAQDHGAILFEDCAVTSINDQAHQVIINTKKGIWQADAVIIADGAHSPLAKLAGWQDTRHLIPALESEITVSEDIYNRFSQAAQFDFDLAPYGYAWIFPKRNHLSIGVLSMQRGAINLRTILEKYLQQLGINKILNRSDHGALIPVTPRRDQFTKGRIMLAGDAAGLADPITAEGISFAMQSGILAAKALINAQLDPIITNKTYQQEIHNEILDDLYYSRIPARLLYYYPRMRNLLFTKYGARLSEAITDLIMGQRTYRSIITAPKNYLKLFGLR